MRRKKIILMVFFLIILICNLSASSTMLRDDPGTLDWSFETNGYIHNCSPAIDTLGNIYFGNYADTLYSLNPEGELNWVFPTEGNITASPNILPDGRICFGSCDHNFYMLNNDGSLCWSFDANSSIPYSAAIRYDGIIYFGCNSGILYALDFDGDVIWSRNIPEVMNKPPVIGPDGTIYIATSNQLFALNEYGTTKWQKPASGNTCPVLDGDRVYYFNGYCLVAVDFSGNSIWTTHSFEFDNIQSTPVIGKNGNIYFGLINGQLRAYNRNGIFLWYTPYEPGSHIKTGPLIDDAGNISYGCSNDNFYSIASVGSQNWVFQTDGSITSSPAITSDGNLVFGSYDGNLYCLYGYESSLSKYASPMYGVDAFRSFSYYSNIYPSKNRILFDYTIVNTTEEDTLFIYNNTDETLEVFYEYYSDVFQVSLLNPSNQIAPDDSLSLLISFQPVEEEITEINLRIYTNHRNAPEHNIYLFGNGVHLDPGEMVWNLPMGDSNISSPAMDDNGTIYFEKGGSLYAVTDNSEILWYYTISGNITSPVITPDNKILIAKRYDTKLYCINDSGNLEWIYETESEFRYPPAVDLDGNIFITNEKNLISLTPEADERWIYHFGNIRAASSPALSADGTIYYSNSNSQLVAVTKNGLHKFTFQGEEHFHQPVIDDDSTIYITSISMTISKFYAIHPDGSLIYQSNLYGWAESPVIIGNDYLYYAMQVSGGSRVYSLEKETFAMNWASNLIPLGCFDPFTLSSNGSVFITSNGNNYNSYLTAIDTNGNIRWQFNPYELEFDCKAGKTPLICQNGNIILPSRAGSQDISYLFAIEENATAADSPWHTLGQDETHSSMAKNSIIPGPNIMINKDNLDFGIVDPGCSESLDFTIFNDGDSLLVFTYELNGEGFSIPNLTRYTLSPGDSTIIEIVFAPQEDEDPIHQGSLLINSNDYDQPQILISLFGRSNLEGTLKWKIPLAAELQCTPAVDDLGNIYIFDSDLYCIAPDGEIKWVRDYFRDRYFYCNSVTISDDNTIIYVPPMRAVDSTGVLLFNTPVYNANFTTPIALDANGQLYFGNWKSDGAGLFAFGCNGEPIWDYTITHQVYAAPIIDPEGDIFFIGTPSSGNGSIFSFDSDGNMNWWVIDEFAKYSLALGFDDKLYALDDDYDSGMRIILKCLDTQGNLFWEFITPDPAGGFCATSPVIDEQGNIFFADTDGKLYSVSTDGNMNWNYELYERVQSTPAIGANGVIYIGCDDGALYAINNDGTLRWSYQTESDINDHIVITNDEMIYFTNETGYLYAVYGLNGGLADSPWPMIHQNPKHNCRLDEYYVSCGEDNIVSKNYFLKNYPNPFNPSTTISFSLNTENTEDTEIIIYNIKGQKVKTLDLESASPSPFSADGVGYSITWNGTDSNNQPVSSGIYLYQLKISEKKKASKKCLLLK